MKILLATFSLVTLALFVASTGRAQFVPGPNPIDDTETHAQSLTSGTGEVSPTGKLEVSGGSVAITVNGTSAIEKFIKNNGMITQTGNGRAIRDDTGGLSLTVTNNADATLQTADADAIQMNQPNSNISFDNYGKVISLNESANGAQAIDWNAITTGRNTLHNYPTGLIEAHKGDAVRPGKDGRVINEGTIKAITSGDGVDGADDKINSGIVISNNGRLFATRWGGWLRNIHGIIEGAGHGITAGDDHVNVILSVTNQLFCIIRGNDGAGINIDGDDATEVVTIRNYGLITGNGVTGDGDGVDVDGIVDLTNEWLGVIQSLNSSSGNASEGISVGGGTIVNSGTIKGEVAGVDTDVDGRGITLAGIDKKDDPGTREPIYANSTITNSGLIKGQTDSAIVVLGAASGFTVTINNESRGKIEGGGDTAAAIQTAADSDTLNNAGDVIAGASGKAIDLGAGNDTLNITGGTIQGDISGGSGTNTCTIDPGARNFTYTDSISNFNSVEIKSGVVSFFGASTYSGTTTISGGTLIAANSTGSATGNSAVRVTAGTLGGNGIIGGVTIGGGSGPALLSPGAPEQQEATLTIRGTLKFETGGTYLYTFRANPPFNFSADKVIANGVTLPLASPFSGSATLLVRGKIHGRLPVGLTFTVISNTATTPIVRTFANLSEGEIITIQSNKLRVSYKGGDGNDLTLTVVS
jgi:autotransporter-associated beta strand protein